MKPQIPNSLPLKHLNWTSVIEQIGAANRELARYDGLLQSIPNPNVLLSPLTTQEAVLSSKIEGTQATLEEVLEFEANPKKEFDRKLDIHEIINYRKAMSHATKEIKERGMTNNFLKRTHSILLKGVRGQHKDRGNFRKIQNWIGSPESTMESARFVPPSPLVLQSAMDDLEKYIHFDEKDRLVQLAIIHAQFEIIHPFLDGNGRLGRILIPLFLYDKRILHQPVFYLSAYLEANRQEYYDRLKEITDNNNWEQWIEFFLNALVKQAKANIEKTKSIIDLYNDMKTAIVECTHSQFAIQTLDCLFHMPVFSTSNFLKFSDIPRASANRILTQLAEQGIIKIMEPGKGRRPTIFQFRKLLDIVK